MDDYLSPLISINPHCPLIALVLEDIMNSNYKLVISFQLYDFCVYVLLSGIVDPSTAFLCEKQGQVSMKDCINKLLEIDISKNPQGASDKASGFTSHGEGSSLDGAYAIKDPCQVDVSSGKSKKFKHLSFPELNLMQVEYKVVYDITVSELSIDPFVQAQMVKEEDSYVIFRKDRNPVCCLREQVKKQDIQVGQIMYYFTDTQAKKMYEWAVLDVFPTISVDGMFLKAKTLTRRRLLLPKKCISNPVITAKSPDSIWHWFINVDLSK